MEKARTDESQGIRLKVCVPSRNTLDGPVPSRKSSGWNETQSQKSSVRVSSMAPAGARWRAPGTKPELFLLGTECGLPCWLEIPARLSGDTHVPGHPCPGWSWKIFPRSNFFLTKRG